MRNITIQYKDPMLKRFQDFEVKLDFVILLAKVMVVKEALNATQVIH